MECSVNQWNTKWIPLIYGTYFIRFLIVRQVKYQPLALMKADGWRQCSKEYQQIDCHNHV